MTYAERVVKAIISYPPLHLQLRDVLTPVKIHRIDMVVHQVQAEETPDVFSFPSTPLAAKWCRHNL